MPLLGVSNTNKNKKKKLGLTPANPTRFFLFVVLILPSGHFNPALVHFVHLPPLQLGIVTCSTWANFNPALVHFVHLPPLQLAAGPRLALQWMILAKWFKNHSFQLQLVWDSLFETSMHNHNHESKAQNNDEQRSQSPTKNRNDDKSDMQQAIKMTHMKSHKIKPNQTKSAQMKKNHPNHTKSKKHNKTAVHSKGPLQLRLLQKDHQKP